MKYKATGMLLGLHQGLLGLPGLLGDDQKSWNAEQLLGLPGATRGTRRRPLPGGNGNSWNAGLITI